MSGLGRIAAAAALAALLGAAPATAADFCVSDAAPCLPTLADALQAARDSPGADRVLLPAGEHQAPATAADAAGEPVEIVGDGPGTRVVAAPEAAHTLRLDEPASRVTSVTAAAPGAAATATLVLAGGGANVVVEGPEGSGTAAVSLAAGGWLADAVVSGAVTAVAPARVERSRIATAAGIAVGAVAGDAGDARVMLENVEIEVAEGAGAALGVTCTSLLARNATITGTAPRALLLECPEEGERMAAGELRSSVVHGTFADIVERVGDAVASSAYSAHPDDPSDLTATARVETADPGFRSPTDRRPAPGSPLVDAGDPEPLQPGHGFWDAGNRPRVTDGDADGLLRRDIGAHELQPPAPPVPSENVLLNPGAELGEAIATTGEGPEPPGWTRTGGFTQVAYGTTTRTAAGQDVTLPTRETGEALIGGAAFFSAGPGPGGSLLQRVDLAASAAEIDTGLATAALSGLLGGYGADEDEVRVTATFRDPAGEPLGALALGPVPAADRANATMLLHRSVAGAIPPRTRAIDVEIAGTRSSAPGSAETYADAYADNLALVLSVPGIAAPGPVDPGNTPPVKNLKAFAGVTVLTPRARISPRGRVKLRVGCASATVGACSGSLELRGPRRRGAAYSRIAQFARFTIAPGRRATVTVKLTLAARRALRRTRSLPAALRAVARDGQGLERRTTIPIRLRRR